MDQFQQQDSYQKEANELDEQVNSQLVGEFFDNLREDIGTMMGAFTKISGITGNLSTAVNKLSLYLLDLDQRIDAMEKKFDEIHGTNLVERSALIKREQIEALSAKTPIGEKKDEAFVLQTS